MSFDYPPQSADEKEEEERRKEGEEEQAAPENPEEEAMQEEREQYVYEKLTNLGMEDDDARKEEVRRIEEAYKALTPEGKEAERKETDRLYREKLGLSEDADLEAIRKKAEELQEQRDKFADKPEFKEKYEKFLETLGEIGDISHVTDPDKLSALNGALEELGEIFRMDADIARSEYVQMLARQGDLIPDDQHLMNVISVEELERMAGIWQRGIQVGPMDREDAPQEETPELNIIRFSFPPEKKGGFKMPWQKLMLGVFAFFMGLDKVTGGEEFRDKMAEKIFRRKVPAWAKAKKKAEAKK
jgi:hypothetical protein